MVGLAVGGGAGVCGRRGETRCRWAGAGPGRYSRVHTGGYLTLERCPRPDGAHAPSAGVSAWPGVDGAKRGFDGRTVGGGGLAENRAERRASQCPVPQTYAQWNESADMSVPLGPHESRKHTSRVMVNERIGYRGILVICTALCRSAGPRRYPPASAAVQLRWQRIEYAFGRGGPFRCRVSSTTG
ncbi:hypothetical protein BC628DRAFT_1351472 [Trametes gibbosa]|nr:hypothetical protein BC628DRAFT_1351472 [Trametes gibbosa]